MSSFDVAFDRVLGHEGRFQNDPQDRGNWTTGVIGQGELRGTKFGISSMSYPTVDIRNLTPERAKIIYRRDFWVQVGGDDMHAAISYQLFDAAINHGAGNAIRILQRAVDVAEDGDYGPVTRAAVEGDSVDNVLHRFNAYRIKFFIKLQTFDRYGRGWMDRVATNMLYSADDYSAPWHLRLEVT